MMKSELEKNGPMEGAILIRWTLSVRDYEWASTSWMLLGMRIATDNEELREELQLLEDIADWREDSTS